MHYLLAVLLHIRQASRTFGLIDLTLAATLMINRILLYMRARSFFLRIVGLDDLRFDVTLFPEILVPFQLSGATALFTST